MDTISVDLDREIVELLDNLKQPVRETVQEMVVIHLYWRQIISSGKAAELLGMERLVFIQYSGRLGIPFLDMPEEEWEIERARGQTL
jgi:predicted HTH domain antitoxin